MNYKMAGTMMGAEIAPQNSGGNINWVLVVVIVVAVILGIVAGILLGKHAMKKRDI